MKKRKALLAWMMACLLFYGCGGSPKTDHGTVDTGNESNETIQGEEKELQNGDRVEYQLTDEVRLDAALEIPDAGFGAVESCHVIADGIQAEAYAGNLGISAPLSEWDVREGFGYEPDIVYSYTGDIIVGDSGMPGFATIGFEMRMFTDHWYSKCQNNFPIYSDGSGVRKPISGVSITGDLDFMTMEEAAETGKAFLARLGEANVRFQYGLSFSHEDMQAYQESQYYDPTVEATGKPQEYTLDSWSEEDDCYWLFYEMVVNGLPLVSDPVTRQDEVYIPSGTIEVGVTPNGVENIYQSVHYKVIENKKAELLSVEEVCEALQRKFEMAITGELVIDEMKLVYYPYPTQTDPEAPYEFDLLPVWQFSYEQAGTRVPIYMNASDGTEIVG